MTARVRRIAEGATLSGAMSIGHKGMLYAARAMALIGARLIDMPAQLAEAGQEFTAATAERPYRTPLPEGLQPPLP